MRTLSLLHSNVRGISTIVVGLEDVNILVRLNGFAPLPLIVSFVIHVVLVSFDIARHVLMSDIEFERCISFYNSRCCVKGRQSM